MLLQRWMEKSPMLHSVLYRTKEWMTRGYRQLGLKYDDILDIEESDVGQLALKRLSAKDSYDRIYRIRRAVQLSIQHKILPKEEWTKMEEDTPYLRPIIEQIQKELKEKADMDSLEVVKKH